MNLHDVYNLATKLPGSWLLNKSTLDNAIEHVPYEKAHRAAGHALYNMIQENLKKDNQDYKDTLQQMLQQLTSDPEINDAIETYTKQSEALSGYGDNPTGIVNPADYISKIKVADVDNDGDGDVIVEGSYW